MANMVHNDLRISVFIAEPKQFEEMSDRHRLPRSCRPRTKVTTARLTSSENGRS